ncbi:hypothetical protein [Gemmata sp. SH-PL17]|uniref:hypothetical protein n=1 Tax=Gemmata sp. SH-PL17 TaxID=1630693 RepID=UPI0012FCE278|nr:hypothetical protein [Gemmata sp. SH-PL17]
MLSTGHRPTEPFPVTLGPRDIPGLGCPDRFHRVMRPVPLLESLSGAFGEHPARLLGHPQSGQLFEPLLGPAERFEDPGQGDQRLHPGAVSAVQEQRVVGRAVPGPAGRAVVVRAGALGPQTVRMVRMRCSTKRAPSVQ